MKSLPAIIGILGETKLWGVNIDKSYGLMVGTGDTPEAVESPVFDMSLYQKISIPLFNQS